MTIERLILGLWWSLTLLPPRSQRRGRVDDGRRLADQVVGRLRSPTLHRLSGWG